MDSWTYGCDPNQTFTMKVLECDDTWSPEEYLKVEKFEVSDEKFLLDKEKANITRRKTIEEKVWNDGFSPSVKNEIICHEIVDISENKISEDINHYIKIETDKELMENENVTHFDIRDDEPQREEHTISNFEKNSQLPPREDTNLSHKEKTLLELNLNARNENIIKCVVCNLDFQRKAGLRNNKENAFKCGHCNKEFNTTGIIARTARSKYRYSNNFECYQCSEIFFLKTTLDKHLLIHENKKSFECLLCSRKFVRKWYLLTHACKVLKSQKKVQDIPKSNTTKSFECHYCNKKFCEKRYLKQHIFIHTGERPFECKLCNFKFRFSSNLYRHIQKLHRFY